MARKFLDLTSFEYDQLSDHAFTLAARYHGASENPKNSVAERTMAAVEAERWAEISRAISHRRPIRMRKS